jgi:adenylate cyclase
VKKFLGITCLTAALAVLLYFTPFGRLFDLKFYDLYSSERSSPPPTGEVVMVGIDEESFSELNRPWPWPRSWHGQLIKALGGAGAKGIIMEIIFADPSNPEEDEALTEAIRQFGKVTLAADIEVIKSENVTQSVLVKPLDQLLEAGALYGVSSIIPDRDNVVRRFFWGTPEAPSLEVAALKMLDIPTAADYSKMVHFTDPGFPFPYVPYYKALDPDLYLPEGFFRNKLVLVGKYSRSSGEAAENNKAGIRKLHFEPPSTIRGTNTFATPYYIDGGDDTITPGIEIHANMLASLLKSDYVRPFRDVEAVLLIIGLCALLSALNYNWKPLKSISLNFAVTAAYIFASYSVFSKMGLFAPITAPMIAIFINFVASGVSSYSGVEKKRRYLKSVFSLSVSPQVAEKILEDPEKLKLGGERVTATVLFSDIAGFTEISESREPEEVVSIVTRHATEMSRILFKHGGTLDKFIGDAIMAIWGSPVKDEDQALHACLAALEMQKRMETLADEIVIPGYRLSMRVGINTGLVMAGNMGSEDRFDFTVIGDNVNLAARLEPLNKLYGTKIMISEFTREKLGDRLKVRELDSVRVKGKKKVIRIFELTGRDRTLFDDTFEEGLRLYREGAFQAARDKFIEASEMDPKDGASKLFVGRCGSLINSPPGDKWTGVWDSLG